MTRKDPSKAQNLWFLDGARYDRVDASILPGGGLRIRRRDLGPGEFAAWGEDEHEATLELSPEAVAALVLVLLKANFTGRADALEAVRDVCEAHGVEAQYGLWS